MHKFGKMFNFKRRAKLLNLYKMYGRILYIGRIGIRLNICLVKSCKNIFSNCHIKKTNTWQIFFIMEILHLFYKAKYKYYASLIKHSKRQSNYFLYEIKNDVVNYFKFIANLKKYFLSHESLILDAFLAHYDLSIIF